MQYLVADLEHHEDILQKCIFRAVRRAIATSRLMKWNQVDDRIHRKLNASSMGLDSLEEY